MWGFFKNRVVVSVIIGLGPYLMRRLMASYTAFSLDSEYLAGEVQKQSFELFVRYGKLSILNGGKATRVSILNRSVAK